MGDSVDGAIAGTLRARRIDTVVAIAVAPAVLLQACEALGANARLAAAVLDSSQSFARSGADPSDLVARAGMLCLAAGLVLLLLAPRLTSPVARGIVSGAAGALALGFSAAAAVAYVSSAATLGASVGDAVSDTFSRYFTVGAIGAGLLGVALVVGAVSASPLAKRSRYAAHGIAAAAWIAAAGGLAGAGIYGFVVMKAVWGVYFVPSPLEIARHALQGATVLACLAMALRDVFSAGSEQSADAPPARERERVSSAA